jgi:hypothetical protein
MDNLNILIVLMIWMVQSNFIPTFCSFSTSSNHWTHRSLRDAFVWHVFFMSKSTNMKKTIEQSTHPPSGQRSWPGSGLDFGGSFGPAIDGLKPKTSTMSVSTCIWKWIIAYYFYIYMLSYNGKRTCGNHRVTWIFVMR